MVKISENWLTHLVFATLQAFRLGLVGAVSLQNTQMASNMIVDITQEHLNAVEMVNARFKMQIRAKMW